jgi:hypothetical protein
MQENKTNMCCGASITFLQIHNMLKMNAFSPAENIHSGKYNGCRGLG